MIVLSLDISASSTGWCVLSDTYLNFGIIQTVKTLDRSERLLTFKYELIKIMNLYKPTSVVLEDNFSSINVSTLKLLAEFAGVAKLTVREVLNMEAYVISNNTVKSYFKVKKKDDLFKFVSDIFEFKNFDFKKHNDIVDAIAQVVCYSDSILNFKKFREIKEYGFLYEIKGVKYE